MNCRIANCEGKNNIWWILYPINLNNLKISMDIIFSAKKKSYDSFYKRYIRRNIFWRTFEQITKYILPDNISNNLINNDKSVR